MHSTSTNAVSMYQVREKVMIWGMHTSTSLHSACQGGCTPPSAHVSMQSPRLAERTQSQACRAPLILAWVTRLEDMPEGSAEANLAAFDGALAQAARALRAHGFLPATAAAGGSDAPTLALSSSAGNLQARMQPPWL